MNDAIKLYERLQEGETMDGHFIHEIGEIKPLTRAAESNCPGTGVSHVDHDS